MNPLELVELSPGEFCLSLDAGYTSVDDVIEKLGHEPNGYFWEGVAKWLVKTEAPALDGRFTFDSEGGMFSAYGTDRSELESLALRMAVVANDPARARQLIASAEADGFEFDD